MDTKKSAVNKKALVSQSFFKYDNYLPAAIFSRHYLPGCNRAIYHPGYK